MLPEEMKQAAFRAENGEFGWTRAQVPGVVARLHDQGLAILGGEVWWVLDGARTWNGLVPQRRGPDLAYDWETLRKPLESWPAFVSRCAADTVAAVETLPPPADG